MIDAAIATTLLAACLVVGVLSQGRFSNSVAGMAMPGLLVVTAASLGGWVGPVLVGVLFAIATWAAWRGVLPGPPTVLLGTALGSGVLIGLALAASLFAAELTAWAGPPVFSAIIAGAEMLSSRSSSYGEWGSLAHSQARQPWALMVARKGPFAVTAVLVAVSSAVGFSLVDRSLPLGFTAIAIAVLIWSLSQRPRVETTRPHVRVAGLLEEDHEFFRNHVSEFVGDAPLADDWWTQFRKTSLFQHRDLVQRTVAAGRDADLVVWAEGAGLVDATDFSAAVTATSEVARKARSYIVASWLVLDRDTRLMDNVVTVLDPAGDLVLTQRKLFPVPGPEAEHTAAVPPQVPEAVDTPFGRLAVVICFDADHGASWRRVADSRARIVAVPASDWPAIGPLHADMAILRSRSVGAAIVRPSRYGVSVMTMAAGRVAAEVDHRQTNAPDLISER